jgi:hypothetical protein
MNINPNHIPWMTILGVIGLGIGYLAAGSDNDPKVFALYGLIGGSLLGIVVRVAARYYYVRRQTTDDKTEDK